MSTGGRPSHWPDTLVRIGRVAAIATASTVGAAALAAIILYDANFYAARDRWEHFKQAMFGEWMPTRRPGRRGEASPASGARTLDDIFTDLANVGVFETVPVIGTALKVVTGSTYLSSRDLLANKASQRSVLPPSRHRQRSDAHRTGHADCRSRAGLSAHHRDTVWRFVRRPP